MKAILIALALLVRPVYADDSQLQKRREDCQKSASKRWDARLNRCVSTMEAYRTREEFQECQGLEDQAARKKCFMDLAEKKSGVKQGQKAKGGSTLETISIGLSAAYGLLGLIALASGEKFIGGCYSKMVMTGGSVAHLLAHFFLVNSAKKKLDESYQHFSKAGKVNDHELQREAFIALREEQNTIKKYASKRKMVYTIVMAAYGAAAAVAVLEHFQSFNLKPCKYAGEEPREDASTFSKLAKKVGKVLVVVDTSWKVAMWSTVGGALAFKLRQGAAKQEQESKANIKKIDEILKGFDEMTAASCPKGRTDMHNPRCYCYTETGAKNNKRTQSAICRKYWEKSDKNFFVASTKYGDKPQWGRTGCLTRNNNIDPNCRCRRMVDKNSGRNACYQAGTDINIPAELGGNLAGARESAKALNRMTGASKSGSINQAALNKAAIRTRGYAQRLLGRYNRKARENKTRPINVNSKLVKAMAAKYVTPKVAKAFSSGLSGVSMASVAQAGLSPKVAQALNKARERSVKKVSYSKSAGAKKRRGSKKEGFQWQFDSPSSSKGGSVVVLPGKKSSAYGDADISKSQGRPIWESISRRYMSSGFSRLFGDKLPGK